MAISNRRHLRNRRIVLFVLLLLAVTAACKREVREPVIGTAYVASGAVNLRDRLGAQQTTVATLKAAERLEILQRRRRWLRVRTAAGQEGWIEERHLVSQDIVSRFEALRKEAAGKPSQGEAHARRDLNLHLEPGRKTPFYYQLKEEESCEVVGRAASERPPPAGQPPPEVKKFDEWFLVRAQGKAGWGLAANIDLNVPDEVLQYAEGRRVVAWFILDPGPQDDGENKPTILWATAPNESGLAYDFESIRVFAWGRRRKRYETTYIERNLKGYFPIQISRQATGKGEVPAFSVPVENKQGQRVTRRFLLMGNYVRKAG